MPPGNLFLPCHPLPRGLPSSRGLPNVGSRRVNCCQARREKELAGEESLLRIPRQELRMQELGMWSLSPSPHHLLQLSPGKPVPCGWQAGKGAGG